MREGGENLPWLAMLSAPPSTELPGWESFFMSLTKSMLIIGLLWKSVGFGVELFGSLDLWVVLRVDVVMFWSRQIPKGRKIGLYLYSIQLSVFNLFDGCQHHVHDPICVILHTF